MNACPEGALTLGERIHVDRTRCTLCGRCVDACPAAAMSVQGRSISAQEAAELLLRDRTSFLIAHRLSTIRKADLILVVRDGRIVEQGRHLELLQKGGYYHDLYTRQFAEESAARILK